MEADSHLNFVSHSAVSANSGTTLSPGESQDTNGSPISLRQPGKNMNGPMNVNGITTVKGPGLSPPPYALIGHPSQQTELEYDYLWEQQQYSPTTSMALRATPHQQQEHRQSLANSGLVASCPPDVTLGKGGYWNRSTPGQQHGSSPKPMEYSSHGGFQNPPHLNVVHQQHNRNLQPQQHHFPNKHQPSQQHHLHQPSQGQQQHPSLHQHQPFQQQKHHQSPSQHHHKPSPQHLHQDQPSQQHQQQQPRYGMMFSGVSCFHQLASRPSDPPAQVTPPFSQSYAPQSSSPQQLSLGQEGPANHLSVEVPSPALESSTPLASNSSMIPTAMPAFSQSNGHVNEGCEEVDHSSSGSGQFPVTQRPPEMEGFPSNPTALQAPAPTSPCHSQVQQTLVDYGRAHVSPWVSSRDPPFPFPPSVATESRCEAPNQPDFAVTSNSSSAILTPSLKTGGKQEVSTVNLGREVEASAPQVNALSTDLPETKNGPHLDIHESISRNEGSASGMSTADDSDESASHLEESLSDGMEGRPPHSDHAVCSLPPSEDSQLEELEEEEDVQDTSGLAESAVVGVWMDKMQTAPCDSPASSTGASAEEDHASRGFLCENESEDDTDDGSGPEDRTEDETPAPSPSADRPRSPLTSSPSNCQDPFCSHPYPPSPSPLPATPNLKRAKKKPKIPKIEVKMEDLYHEEGEEEEVSMSSGPRRRIATEEQVHFPLMHGWRREVRVRRYENRLKGETWYYSPCGKRMKQFPEVIKYLKRQQGGVVSRQHFSFSPRMPVGDFYEEQETAEGSQWLRLAHEEVPAMIMAITGKRGRPPNPDRERPRSRARRALGSPGRRPGRPPSAKTLDLLRKVDVRLLHKLEAREILTEEEKERLKRIKRKMKRKLQKAEDGDQEWARPGVTSPRALLRGDGAEQSGWATEEPEDEAAGRSPARSKRASLVRGEAKALAKARAEKEAQAQASETARRQAERRAQMQRHLEERRRQQFFLEELKKPTEDMCLTDHQPLPELPCVPGLVLPGPVFARCLHVLEFLHSFGKVLALQLSQGVPSLAALQEGLLGVAGSEGVLLDLLVQLVQAALHDPGLPSHYQSVKILGERLGDLELNPSSVSEGLRIFLESRGFEPTLCASLCTRPFQAHSPDAKAAMLAFLVEEVNGSGIITKELDSTLEKMATYRKNKWVIEGKLRKLKAALAQQTGGSAEELCAEEQSRACGTEESLCLEDSRSSCSPKEKTQLAQGESASSASIPDLERQIDKLTKRQVFFRKKLLHASHSLRSVFLGEDRYRRRYWALPHIGGILVEGSEEILGCQGDISVSEDAVPNLAPIKQEPKPEPLPTPPPPAAPPPSGVDPLPGTASLMCSPSGRGRPRKIKPEVELHLRTAKNRRRRGSKEGGANAQPGPSVKEEAERHGQWFNLLPKTPCDPSQPFTDTTSSPGGHPVSQVPQLFPASRSPAPMFSTPVRGRGRGRRRGGSVVGLPGGPRRRGRPPSSLLRQIEEQYLSQLATRPIPTGMLRGWWWVRGPEELAALLKALHPRGIREKALHKHLSKHSEYLSELCARPPSDPMFQQETVAGGLKSALTQVWDWKGRAMQADLSVLQWVEDLEKRVLAAQLHVKGWALPELDSTREDLLHHEHQLDPEDDWIFRPKKEWGDLVRLPSNPLDLAVLRLGRLERAVERRFLKEPLWSPGEVVRLAPLEPPPGEAVPESLEGVESEITLRLRTWRQALERCRSAAQLALCLMQLERTIAWERSGLKVANGDQRPPKPKSRVRKKYPGGCEPGSSDEEEGPRKGGVRRDEPGFSPSPYARFSGDSYSPAKRRRLTTRNQPDLTFCEIILMEMEAHTDAWPFLEPVNPRLVPGYRRVIKNPMDFLTMRERLLQGGYCSRDEFAADARLVFDNCELFNEDTSDVGAAGHSMRRFFESRWAEFYHKGQ